MLLLLFACHSNPTPDDSHRPGDTGTPDTGVPDSGDDTGTDDTGADDTGAPDDTAADDTGADDSGGDDTTPPDTGASDDTGAPDDTALPDDTGGPDTGDTGGPVDPRIGMYVPDFTLPDLNPNSLRYEQQVSPRDYLQQVSGWYFIHST